ncbi:hypothetical protein [Dyella nitratireducens]|uniref:Uncharacterized protein n=1 Tax=Dyella nitratireducens TaxID=1849580 RepID=A0ABQ1FR96_9GAMM|nr:hypothetical protein [Dyella nitratireducens]GGA27540.1 hypothetical protein GCM10010981_15350 [Dyella nitratireducens]GLQ43400.1 hypothetical protein GCM10007902_32500 [Dyella nitratireducens]
MSFAAKNQSCLDVIPAKAGIHALYLPWIPAFAGMTIRSETALARILILAGMAAVKDYRERIKFDLRAH